MKRPTRQWSRAFTPPRGKKIVNLNFSAVPVTLRRRFAAMCRRDGLSQRHVILTWISEWVAGRRLSTVEQLRARRASRR